MIFALQILISIPYVLDPNPTFGARFEGLAEMTAISLTFAVHGPDPKTAIRLNRIISL